MRSREIIAELKAVLDSDTPDKEERYDAMETALKYIADEAAPADMNTIKRLSSIALGREQS